MLKHIQAVREGRKAAGRELGVTFVEVLVVVGLVAILAVVAYPSITGFFNNGYRAQAVQAAGNVNTELEGFIASYAAVPAQAAAIAGTANRQVNFAVTDSFGQPQDVTISVPTGYAISHYEAGTAANVGKFCFAVYNNERDLMVTRTFDGTVKVHEAKTDATWPVAADNPACTSILA